MKLLRFSARAFVICDCFFFDGTVAWHEGRIGVGVGAAAAAAVEMLITQRPSPTPISFLSISTCTAVSTNASAVVCTPITATASAALASSFTPPVTKVCELQFCLDTLAVTVETSVFSILLTSDWNAAAASSLAGIGLDDSEGGSGNEEANDVSESSKRPGDLGG